MNPTWRRSSHSNSSGNGNCVEVGCLHTTTHWRHSTHSSSGGSGQCVEALMNETLVAIRDSKHCAGPNYPIVTTDPATWRGFTHQLASGAFDTVGH